MQRSRIASFSIVAGANILAIVAGLVALELFFGGWFADYHPPSGSIFGRTFTLEQHYYEPHSTVVYTRDQYGLRGSTAPIDKIELVTVGGSTTDQRFITEGETWQDVIHALTGLAITNAGDEGISSTGHVVAVAEWLHLIPNFHPHFYLHYIGVNDAAYAFFATRPQSREAILAHLEDEKNRRALHRIVRGRSAIIQSYLRLKDWFSGPPAVFGAPAPPPKTLGPELSADVDRTPIVDYIERIYKPNLLQLFELHREKGEQAILVSQPARPSLFRREGGTVWVRDPSLAGFAVALTMINDATASLCRAHAPYCTFIDLASRLTFEDAEFYDNVHTTPAGARRIGVFLAEELRQIVKPGS